jgi:hypothetical protein
MKPFLQGKKTLQVEPLRPPSGHTHGTTGLPQGGSAAGKLNGPNVEVVKEGDKVVRLIVTCTCGERVEVECIYPAGG